MATKKLSEKETIKKGGEKETIKKGGEKETIKKGGEKRNKSWSDISGEMRVYGYLTQYKRQEFISYSTSIGRKNDDGYDNLYFTVKFKNDNDPDIEGGFKIEIKSGFISLQVGQNGKIYPFVMVMDYDIIDYDD